MKQKILTFLALLLICFSTTSCGIGDIAKIFGKPSNEEEVKQAGTETIDVVSNEDDQRIRSLINDYLSCLYSEPVESYYSYSLTGKIPPNIRDFISKTTVAAAEGNTEIGLHLPRYVEMNGLVAISFSIDRKSPQNGREEPMIDSRFAENRNGSSFYYVKAELIAKCINENNFKALYTMDTQTKQWRKTDTNPVDENMADFIRIQVRYDVEARKEDGTYKLVTVREANTKDVLENRLLTYNNEFFTRLPYINILKTEDGKTFLREDDQKAYEEEKAVIVSFFKSLFNSFDSESMKLLQSQWKAGTADFKKFLTLVGQPADDSNRKLIDYIDARDDYRTKFNYDSFPLQPGMEKLKEVTGEMEVLPYTGYTKKQKIYLVSFNASLITAVGGIEGKEKNCSYDYLVYVTRTNELLKVSGIKLFGCSEIQQSAG